MLCEAPGDGALAAGLLLGAQGCGSFAVAISAAAAWGPSSSSRPRGGDHHQLCPVSSRRREISRFPCPCPSFNWIRQHFHSRFCSVPSCVVVRATRERVASADRCAEGSQRTPGRCKLSDRSTLTIKSFSCTGISVPSSLGLQEPLLLHSHAAPQLLFSLQLFWA